jgi:hypothetical protein
MSTAVRLLLREPRYFYYLLFPARETVRMFCAFLVITSAEFLIFFVEWNNKEVYADLKSYSTGEQLMINFVQGR